MEHANNKFENGREHWGSRIGLILAMAGNAIGLGNFLRFPTQAASNGGGAFMIPYFIALLLLGIPLMWIEWAIGRYGGCLGHGTLPGVFHKIVRRPWAKYVGVLGLLLSFFISVYYVFIESWTLAYAYFSITGKYSHIGKFPAEQRTYEMNRFLSEFQGITPKVKLHKNVTQEQINFVRSKTDISEIPKELLYNENSHGNFNEINQNLYNKADIPYIEVSLAPKYFQDYSITYLFFFITSIINFYFLYKGLNAGIEQLAKIGMPILFGFAILLTARVITFGNPLGSNWSVADGFNFLWSPDFSKLSQASVWLAAAGQIFFTLSLGTGAIQTYASYLNKKDDIVLTGLATSAMNEFAEVILGGSIAIPAAVAFFGPAATVEIAKSGAFNLGFQSLPIIFTQITFGNVFGFLWFSLLFIAGITSSVALLYPTISFLKDELKLSHAKAVTIVGILYFVLAHGPVLFISRGVLDEIDYWAGTFFLVVLAIIETIIFIWGLSPLNAWKEMHYGAEINIPKFYLFIMKYITPLYISIIFIAWAYQNGWQTLIMENVKVLDKPYIWLTRLVMLLVVAVFMYLIHIRFKSEDPNESLFYPFILVGIPLIIHIASYPGLLAIKSDALIFLVSSWLFVLLLVIFASYKILTSNRHYDKSNT